MGFINFLKEQLQSNQFHYYIVSKTYEIVTPESAEHGDVEESGFEYKNQKYDTLRDLIEDNKENWIEWSSSHLRGEGEWLISEAEPDYHTGAYTSYGLHIKRSDGKPLSRREIDIISKAYGIQNYKYVK